MPACRVLVKVRKCPAWGRVHREHSKRNKKGSCLREGVLIPGPSWNGPPLRFGTHTDITASESVPIPTGASRHLEPAPWMHLTPKSFLLGTAGETESPPPPQKGLPDLGSLWLSWLLTTDRLLPPAPLVPRLPRRQSHRASLAPFFPSVACSHLHTPAGSGLQMSHFPMRPRPHPACLASPRPSVPLRSLSSRGIWTLCRGWDPRAEYISCVTPDSPLPCFTKEEMGVTVQLCS